MTWPSPHLPTGILITGASSGIGAALAQVYSEPNVTLFLSGRHEARLEKVAVKCRALGAQIHTRIIDVRNEGEMRQWVLACHEEHPIDIVIANAGISSGADSNNSNRSIVATNVDGVLNTVQPLIPLMQDRKQGQIVIMSSLAGLRKLPSAPAYSASKVAIRKYGEALREQLAADGIGVSVVMPGFVESRITEQNKFPMPMIMTAERAAHIIKQGLEKNKARIAFPFPMYAMMWIVSKLPPKISDVVLNRLPRKE